jgi:hypothetical protein
MPAKRKRLPLADDVQAMIDDLMPVPVLTDEDVDPLQLLIDAPAEEFQRSLSAPVRRILIAGLRNMPAPRTLKEFASVYAIMEKVEGLNKPAEKGTIPVGMVIPLRHVRRNIGSFPEPPVEVPTVLELEAEMADEVIGTGSPPPPLPYTSMEIDDFEV